jgi:hypothetical protein
MAATQDSAEPEWAPVGFIHFTPSDRVSPLVNCSSNTRLNAAAASALSQRLPDGALAVIHFHDSKEHTANRLGFLAFLGDALGYYVQDCLRVDIAMRREMELSLRYIGRRR